MNTNTPGFARRGLPRPHPLSPRATPGRRKAFGVEILTAEP
ncbi:hypothetical protein [Sinimarinibacterium thermocellulolyticum]|uniref:Uncharacterized protein n=1 Tax=Sinimarinibacterium thermocellulolyticum TaxID=3170016 RepID=A0ABV2AA69_9GAMM